jgi:hypothetical protein
MTNGLPILAGYTALLVLLAVLVAYLLRASPCDDEPRD